MEKVKALQIKVGEAPKEIEIENDFRALQKAVGGLIEFYPVGNNAAAVLNEEGKLIGLKGNRLIGNEIICGDFLIVGDNGFGETVSLTKKQIEVYSEKFKTPYEFTKEQVEDNILIEVMSPEEFQGFIDPRPIPMPKKVNKNFERER